MAQQYGSSDPQGPHAPPGERAPDPGAPAPSQTGPTQPAGPVAGPESYGATAGPESYGATAGPESYGAGSGSESYGAGSGQGRYGAVPGPATPPGGSAPPGASMPPGPNTPPGPARPPAPVVPRWLGQLPYVFVLCGVAAGFVVVAMDHFRRGSMLMAASVLIGALARLLLPEGQVGMLAVRSKWVDVLLMGLAAAGIMIVAFVTKGTAT